VQVHIIAPTTNDIHCSYGAVLQMHNADATDSALAPRLTFSHFGTVPGLSVGLAAVLFDSRSHLYWLVSNVARDGLMSWDTEKSQEPCAPPLSLCRWEPLALCELCLQLAAGVTSRQAQSVLLSCLWQRHVKAATRCRSIRSARTHTHVPRCCDRSKIDER
jgi:hypothetical protein